MIPLKDNEEFVRLVSELSNQCKEAEVVRDEQLQLLGISEEDGTELWLCGKDMPPKLKESFDFLKNYEVLVIISNQVLRRETNGRYGYSQSDI